MPSAPSESRTRTVTSSKAVMAPWVESVSVTSSGTRYWPASMDVMPGMAAAPRALSHRRADLPGHELIVAVAEQLRLRSFAGGNAQDRVEDLLALLLKRHAIENIATVDIHVVDHAPV